MRWIYSDPHYYHKNIIKYCSRPFETMEEMHTTMINKHNSIIDKKDRVFILGDFSFSNKENVSEIVSQLKGNITLIMGNHDRGRTRKWLLECGFDEVIEYPIIVNELFILSHEPVFMNDSMPYINLHGHLHGNVFSNNNYFNVCLENNDFFPFSLDGLIDNFKKKV
jgi:calcineurin-like phosphoesterase family protein